MMGIITLALSIILSIAIVSFGFWYSRRLIKKAEEEAREILKREKEHAKKEGGGISKLS